MFIDKDNAVHLQKGDHPPFVCPECLTPQRYDPKAERVECGKKKCGYIGTPDEFQEVELEFLYVN